MKTKSAAGRRPLWRTRARFGVVASAALTVSVVALVGCGAEDEGRELDVGPLDALSGFVARCSASPEHAAIHAEQLEAEAEARFERAPFDEHEAPVAVVRFAEATECYRVANEREGRMRAEAKRVQAARDLARHVERTQFALAVARRNGQSAIVVREARRLSALTSQAGTALSAYREALAAIERVARAEQAERVRRGEQEK